MTQTTKIYFLLTLFSIFFLWLGQRFGDRLGLLVMLCFILAFNFYIYYFSDKRFLRYFSKKEIEGNDPWGILDLVHDYAKKAYMPVPRIYFAPFFCPITLALGRTKENTHILLSENITKHFDHEELKAILALEMARLKRLDPLPLGMFSNLLSLILPLGYFLDYVIAFQWLFSKKKRKMPMSRILLQITQVLYSIVFPAKTVYETDKLAAELYPDSKQIANVLWKMDSYATTMSMDLPIDMAHLFLVNPLPKEKMHPLLRYQPRYDKRIEKLVGYFPI